MVVVLSVIVVGIDSGASDTTAVVVLWISGMD